MTDFFAPLYEVFNLYSLDLAEHLRGFNTDCTAYDAQAYYVLVGLLLLGISLLATLVYYYLINRPAFSQWYHWLIILLINALIQGAIAFSLTNNDVSIGLYCEELNITSNDCFGFAFSNFIWGIIVYFLFSMVVKWWSTNGKKSPF